jgi:hypothetical protein
MTTLLHLMAAVALAIPSIGGQTSLVRMARENGGSAMNTLDVDMPIRRVETIAQESSTIVTARIVSVGSRLSGDESVVMTDYEIAPIQFYKGETVARSRPGFAGRLVVSRVGGTVVANGLTMTTQVNLYPEDETLQQGDEVIVFMQRDQGEERFRFSGGPFGVFRLSSGMVDGFTGNVRSRRQDRPETIREFEGRLVRAGVRW